MIRSILCIFLSLVYNEKTFAHNTPKLSLGEQANFGKYLLIESMQQEREAFIESKNVPEYVTTTDRSVMEAVMKGAVLHHHHIEHSALNELRHEIGAWKERLISKFPERLQTPWSADLYLEEKCEKRAIQSKIEGFKEVIVLHQNFALEQDIRIGGLQTQIALGEQILLEMQQDFGPDVKETIGMQQQFLRLFLQELCITHEEPSVISEVEDVLHGITESSMQLQHVEELLEQGRQKIQELEQAQSTRAEERSELLSELTGLHEFIDRHGLWATNPQGICIPPSPEYPSGVTLSPYELTRRERLRNRERATATTSGAAEGTTASITSQEGASSNEDIEDSQPSTSATGRPFPGPGTDGSTASFMSGFDATTHLSSLQGVQCLLVPISMQTIDSLKTLVLKTVNTTMKETYFQDHAYAFVPSGTYKTFTHTSKKSGPFYATAPMSQWLHRPSSLGLYQLFSSTDVSQTNLEYTTQSATVGAICYPLNRWSAGIMYDTTHGKNNYSARVIQVPVDSVQATVERNRLSAAIAWNIDTQGLNGVLSSCYGWGTGKTTRYFRHAGESAYAKGHTAMAVYGVLGQLGYTIPLSDSTVLTPYVEQLVVQVTASPYEETQGQGTAMISKHREHTREKSFGIRHQWIHHNTSQLQTWLTKNYRHQRKSDMIVQPRMYSISTNTLLLPGYKKTYSFYEVGLSFKKNVTETCIVGLSGKVQYDTIQKDTKQQGTCYIQYLF